MNKPNDICNNNGCKNNEFTENGIGQLPRVMMPQFSSLNDVNSFIKDVKTKLRVPVTYRHEQMQVKKIVPSQSEINSVMVNAIVDAWPHTKTGIIKHLKKGGPVIVSKSGTVIDGHHRIEALKVMIDRGYLKGTEKIPVVVINLPPWTILSMANLLGYNKHSHKF